MRWVESYTGFNRKLRHEITAVNDTVLEIAMGRFLFMFADKLDLDVLIHKIEVNFLN